jgi:4-hydroxy-3-methylbut-2-en-1-yl diphosphate synthase
MNDFNYRRRHSSTVQIGNVPLGGDNPIRIQSMTSTSTLDTDASVAQCRRIFDAGADYVRLTAQGVREAHNIGEIRAALHAAGYTKPLVADIHFNPKAAFEAAATTDKVRINPGNFVDAARTFKKLEYTDEEYAAELEKIRRAVVPFIAICREHHTAVRLGVNHGSLSDRIMSRYGDTPAGMVESAMEYLRIFREENFNDVAISIKASNTVIMVETVRRLVAEMDREDMHYPLHLGVTEAGDGEDGRIKSAVGIGTLLAEGIGDTVRVSLSEEPELEIPVARKLVDYITAREGHAPISGCFAKAYNRIAPERRPTNAVGSIGGQNVPVVATALSPADVAAIATKPDFFLSDVNWKEVDASDKSKGFSDDDVLLLTSHHANPVGEIEAFIHRLWDNGCKAPVVVRMSYDDANEEDVQVKAGADFGALLLNGLIDGIVLDAPNLPNNADAVAYSFGILQAARRRTTKTEYISCPSCGRTLYDLQHAVKEIKAATSHLKGLKIGIMGCIVNGPGEMADADYGYVGAAVGKVSLYKGKECVERNVPQDVALTHLIDLIKANGDWTEPKQ